MTAIFVLLMTMVSIFNIKIGEEGNIRAMTFNIRYGTANDGDNSWEYRKNLVFRVIGENNCDFVGLQEAMVFQIREILQECPEYACLGVTREVDPEEGEASPILYDSTRWHMLEGNTLWLSETPDTPGSKSWNTSLPRIFTWGRFANRTNGREVLVVNTHYDHRSAEARRNSSRVIIEYIFSMMKGTGTILTGDFNAREHEPPVEYLTSNPVLPMIDVYRFLHPESSESDMTFYGWREHAPGTGRRLDYIFFAGELQPVSSKVIDFNVDGRFPSDHMPVIAEFK